MISFSDFHDDWLRFKGWLREQLAKLEILTSRVSNVAGRLGELENQVTVLVGQMQLLNGVDRCVGARRDRYTPEQWGDAMPKYNRPLLSRAAVMRLIHERDVNATQMTHVKAGPCCRYYITHEELERYVREGPLHGKGVVTEVGAE
jgi:hypothetical protein